MAVSNGGAIELINCKSQCPRCGSLETIPGGTFRETIEGLASLLQLSPNPLRDVEEIIDTLEEVKRKGSVLPLQSKSWNIQFKKWLPDALEKIGIYVGIFGVLHQALTKDPNVHIEYSPTFIQQYNQTLIYEQPTRQPEAAKKSLSKHKRGFGQYGREEIR
jgi:hypothetical protein